MIAKMTQEEIALSQQFAKRQSELMTSVKVLLESLVLNPTLRNGSPESAQAVLKSGMALVPELANIGLANLHGETISSAILSVEPFNYASRLWFKKAMSDKRLVTGEYVVEKATGTWILPMACPILDSHNEVVRIVATGIDAKWIYDLALSSSLPSGTTFTFIDMNGNLLAQYPRPEGNASMVSASSTLFKDMLATPAGSITSFGLDGVKRYLYTTTIRDAQTSYGIMALGFPATMIQDSVRDAMALEITLVCVGLGITLSTLLVGLHGKIVKPSRELLAGFLELSEGHSTHRLRELSGGDEVSELFSSFNSMAAELTAHREKLEDLVTERTKELEKTAMELARSNHELEQFAYVASHDLQEPLRMVASFTQLLEDRYGDKLDQKAHQYIGFAVDGAHRMQRLINDLLTYSRVGTRAKPFEPVDLNETLAEVLKTLGREIERTHASVTVMKMPTIYAERIQMGQVFQNLLSNALKFHGERELAIAISARDDGGTWTFSVKDNGIGIEPQYFERIFIVFQRLHERDAYPGSGIGLSIVKKIVERHRGRVWIESKLGEGTTFHFSIPDLKGEKANG